jgi:hypothetical protein
MPEFVALLVASFGAVIFRTLAIQISRADLARLV